MAPNRGADGGEGKEQPRLPPAPLGDARGAGKGLGRREHRGGEAVIEALKYMTIQLAATAGTALVAYLAAR